MRSFSSKWNRTQTQSVIDYFNISNLCMNKLKKFAMKFSCLILRKIAKIVVTRGQILMHKMHHMWFWVGLCPRPRWGSLQSFPRSHSWILWALLLGEGKEKKEGDPKEWLTPLMFQIRKNTLYHTSFPSSCSIVTVSVSTAVFQN